MKRNDAVDWFAGRMKEKLNFHSEWRSGWHNMKPRKLLKRIRDELHELENAIGQLGDKKTADDVIDECVDTANYAMFLAHNVSQKKEPRDEQ